MTFVICDISNVVNLTNVMPFDNLAITTVMAFNGIAIGNDKPGRILAVLHQTTWVMGARQ